MKSGIIATMILIIVWCTQVHSQWGEPTKNEVLIVKGLTVVDEHGNARITLGCDQSSASITLTAGDKVITLGANDEDARITVSGGQTESIDLKVMAEGCEVAVWHRTSSAKLLTNIEGSGLTVMSSDKAAIISASKERSTITTAADSRYFSQLASTDHYSAFGITGPDCSFSTIVDSDTSKVWAGNRDESMGFKIVAEKNANPVIKVLPTEESWLNCH